MVENIDQLDKKVGETQPTTYNNQRSNFDKKPQKNLWEDNNIKALSFNILEKIYGNKCFTVFYNSRINNVPEDAKTRLLNAVKYLSKQGFTYRAWYAGDDYLGTALTAGFTEHQGANVEWYIPWKKYNEKVPNPTSKVNTELAYQLVRGCHKGWDKLPPAVRAICARDIEVFLSKDGKHPLTFILIYTPDGIEELPEKPDFKVLGQLSFILRVAKDLGIPVFNIKNDVSERLKALLEGKREIPKPTQETMTQEVATPAPQPTTVTQPQPQVQEQVQTSQLQQQSVVESDPIDDMLG